MPTKIKVMDNFLNTKTREFATKKEADEYIKNNKSIGDYVDDMYEYLYTHNDEISLNGKTYDSSTLSLALDYLMENNSKVNKFVKDHYLYDVSDRPLAAVVIMFVKNPSLGFKSVTEKAIAKIEQDEIMKEQQIELERQAKIQRKIDHINEQRARTFKGFKTATYGRKSHRNNITQLENSVRRMF